MTTEQKMINGLIDMVNGSLKRDLNERDCLNAYQMASVLALLSKAATHAAHSISEEDSKQSKQHRRNFTRFVKIAKEDA